MIEVRVYINGQVIGSAKAFNVSDIADVSSYEVEGQSSHSPVTKAPQRFHEFAIKEHNRRQTAWALVRKIAAEIEDRELARGGSV